MATSKIEVFNLALTKLGQDRAVSPEDDTEQARVLRSIWDLTVDAVLADHPWKFAIKRDELPAQASVPLFGWTRRFQLPDICLRLVEVGDDWVWHYGGDHPRFAVEDRCVLTDEDAPLRVRYVQRVSNAGLWVPLFARAVAMRLAADAALKLSGSNKREEVSETSYIQTIRMAKRQNAIERPPQKADQSDWLSSRED